MNAPTILPHKDETIFEYWASFSPLAPMFGVDWRFSQLFNAEGAMAEAAKKSTKKAVKNAAQVTREAGKISGDRMAKSAARTSDASAKVVEAATKTVEVASKAVAEAAADVQETVEKATAEVMAKPAELFATQPLIADDLKLIKGVGPKLERELNALGVYTYEQIAKFTRANLVWADENLSTIKGRPMRDDWVAQAKALMK